MSTASPTMQAYRASLLHFRADPAFDDAAALWHEDGLLVIEDGRVKAAGDYAALAPTLPDGCDPVDYRGKLIVPGFIDTHLHYPQTTASIAPAWMTILNTTDLAPVKSIRLPIRIRWPVDEIGRNSVKPSTRPMMIALMARTISMKIFVL
jgi:hypothetical protein